MHNISGIPCSPVCMVCFLSVTCRPFTGLDSKCMRVYHFLAALESVSEGEERDVRNCMKRFVLN